MPYFIMRLLRSILTLEWRHNGRDGVSNHQPHHCLLNRLFRRGSKKHQSSASLAFVLGIHRWPVNSPHKWQVTRKMFPFDDVIMRYVRMTAPYWVVLIPGPHACIYDYTYIHIMYMKDNFFTYLLCTWSTKIFIGINEMLACTHTHKLKYDYPW